MSGASQESPTCDGNLMSRIAASLRFAPMPALAVAGLTPDGDIMQTQPVDRTNHVPLHRASYHGEYHSSSRSVKARI